MKHLPKYVYIFEKNRLTTWILKIFGGTLMESLQNEKMNSLSSSFSFYKTCMLTDTFWEKLNVIQTEHEADSENIAKNKPDAELVSKGVVDANDSQSKSPSISNALPPPKTKIISKVIGSYAPPESGDPWNDSESTKKMRRMEEVLTAEKKTNTQPVRRNHSSRFESGLQCDEESLNFQSVLGNGSLKEDLTEDLKAELNRLSIDLDSVSKNETPLEGLGTADRPEESILPKISDSPEWTYGFDDQYSRKVLAVTVKFIKKMDHQDAADFVTALDPLLADQVLKDKDLPAVVKGIVIGKKLGVNKLTLNGFLESQNLLKEKTSNKRDRG